MAVVGGQFGSEGKGSIVGKIADRYALHVRTGGPNAGHTVYHKGRRWAMQTIPCGWVNPEALLILGRGAIVSPEILLREIEMLEQAGYSIYDRLYIDAYATTLTEEHHREEGGTEGVLHQRIGSTGEGVGAARHARLRRDDSQPLLASDVLPKHGLEDLISDTVSLINGSIDAGYSVLLEGTQGSGLSLTHGPWPYVTTTDTNAGQLCVDAGISPLLLTDVCLVVRTFPIRVAGNSGPLAREITWKEVSAIAKQPIEERTTVTKKVRRVGHFDPDMVERAMTLNRPTCIALTFWDYLFPQDAGEESLSVDAHLAVLDWQARYFNNVPVRFVGLGGESLSVVEL